MGLSINSPNSENSMICASRLKISSLENPNNNPDSRISRDCWERSGGMLKVDPVQASPEWEDIIYEVEKEVDEQLKDEPRGMGFCFSYWSAKRAALARHGIQWRSPSEMNPRVMFD